MHIEDQDMTVTTIVKTKAFTFTPKEAEALARVLMDEVEWTYSGHAPFFSNLYVELMRVAEAEEVS
jgi:hypothetical protein